MTFPQRVLDQLILSPAEGGAHDPPRAMMAWAHEGRFGEQPFREQPEQSGTTNQRIQRCAAWLVATGCREPRYVEWMVDQMARWRRDGEQLGEQMTDTYDGHYIGALVQAAEAAIRAESSSLAAALLDAIERWVSLRLLVTDPLTLRSGGPGRRCGDRYGRSVQRDIAVCLLTRQHVPGGWRWPLTDQVMMEPRLVEALARSLPKVPRSGGRLPVLEDEMLVRFHAGGYAAFTPTSTMKTGRGGAILWAVVHRHGTGDYEAVGWRDLGLPYNEVEARGKKRLDGTWAVPPNPRRPYARQMGGQPMPLPLPDMSLGAELGTVTVPRAGGATRPPRPPAGGEEEERELPPTTPTAPAPAAGQPRRHLLHVLDPETNEPRTLVVETGSAGDPVKFIREHREPVR